MRSNTVYSIKRGLGVILALIFMTFAVSCENPSVSPSNDPANSPAPSVSLPTPDASENVEIDGEDALLIEKTVTTYQNSNIAYLRVQNVSQKTFNVTVNGKYLAEDGSVIKSESKTFEGFPGDGYSNYFLFMPEIKFADLEYTVNLTPYEGESFAKYVTFGTQAKASASMGHVNKAGEWFIPTGADEVKNSKTVICIGLAVGPMVITKEALIDYNLKVVVFNSEGEIIHIGYRGQGRCNFRVNYEYFVGGLPLIPTDTPWENKRDEDNYVIPEEYQSLTGFVALESIKRH